VPDTAARSAGVTRLSFDPVTETVSNPVAVAPAAGLGTDRPVASALGEDGSLYVGFPRSGAIVRISNPAGGSQSVQRVASTSDDRGVSGLAVAGPDLYLAEGAAVTRLASMAACTAAAPCAAVPTDISAPRRTRDHVRWPGRPLRVGNAGVDVERPSVPHRHRRGGRRDRQRRARRRAIGRAAVRDRTGPRPGREPLRRGRSHRGRAGAPGACLDGPRSGRRSRLPRPVADLAPSAGLAFGTVTVGQSVSQNATLANTGDATLTIAGIAVSGAGAADFAIDGTACRSSLPAGSSCTIAVAFSPTAAGPQGAELVVTDDRGGSVPRTQRLARSGTGVARATKPTSAPTPASTASTSPSSTASSTASATKAASTRCSSSAPREPWRSAHPSGTR
jgi:hypothetical protein